MELMTISSVSSARTQPTPWYQGWRYLFHPSERLPPYSVIVNLPLLDVAQEGSTTQVCPGNTLRYYEQPQCGDAVNAATQRGTVLIMDSKLVRRDGGYVEQQGDRPVLQMMYSRIWFTNMEAYVQRSVSFLQTLHQRRYWEQWVWHTES